MTFADSDFAAFQSFADLKPPRWMYRVVLWRRIDGRGRFRVDGDYTTFNKAKRAAIRAHQEHGDQVEVHSSTRHLAVFRLGYEPEAHKPDFLRPISVSKLAGLDAKPRMRMPWRKP